MYILKFMFAALNIFYRTTFSSSELASSRPFCLLLLLSLCLLSIIILRLKKNILRFWILDLLANILMELRFSCSLLTDSAKNNIANSLLVLSMVLKKKNQLGRHTVWRPVDKIIQKRIFILNNFNILIHFCVVYLPLYHVSIVLYSSTQRYLWSAVLKLVM